jgi:hypothetical protein
LLSVTVTPFNLRTDKVLVVRMKSRQCCGHYAAIYDEVLNLLGNCRVKYIVEIFVGVEAVDTLKVE